MSETARQLHQVADDEVRTANAQLANRLRRLADAALHAAAELAVAEAGERISLAPVHSRYQSVREATAMLTAARSGARHLREEADVRLRSGATGSGRA